MNDDDLDELEGNGYQNVENDPFARRSSHHTQRRSQMPGRSPKKPPSTGVPGAKGNPNAAAQSADGQNLQNKVKQGQESNSKSKNPFSKKKKKDKDSKEESKEEGTEEDTSDMIGDAVQSLPVGLKIKLVAVIAVVVGVIIGIMFLLAIIVEVLGLVGITVEIGGDFHQMMNPPEKTDENADHYDEMMAYFQELSNIELEYQQKCDMAVIDRNYLHGVLSYRYYAENNYEELPLKTVYSNMKGHARNAAELMVNDCESGVEDIFRPNLTNSNWLQIYYQEELQNVDKEDLVEDIFNYVLAGLDYEDFYYGNLDDIDVVQGTCKVPYETDYLNGSKASSTITFKEYVMGIPYGEIDGQINEQGIEAVKALMIAGQSYALARSGWKSGDEEIYVHNGNCWQLSCNTELGCDYLKDQPGGYGTCYTGIKSSGKYWKKPLKEGDAKLALLEKIYDEIRGKVMFNTGDNQIKRASYYSDVNLNGKYCKSDCLGQNDAYKDALGGMNYEQILNKYYKNFYIAELDTSEASGLPSGSGQFITTGKLRYYNQGNYSSVKFCGRSNASIRSSGCGVTSMAMVLANLVNSNVTPVETMKEAYGWHYCGQGISGTDPGYFKKSAAAHGLNYMEIRKNGNITQVATSLVSGKALVIAHMGPGTFTSGGHYIVLAGYNNGKVLVLDPGSNSRTGNWYNLDLVRRELKGSFHIFSLANPSTNTDN